MNIGFRVYIDESGDEGFKFDRPNKGSSRWFVLSAVVTREEDDVPTVRLVDRVRRRLKKPPRATLHFRTLKHEHRLPYVDEISKARLLLYQNIDRFDMVDDSARRFVTCRVRESIEFYLDHFHLNGINSLAQQTK